jgi:hypothetical protein
MKTGAQWIQQGIIGLYFNTFSKEGNLQNRGVVKAPLSEHFYLVELLSFGPFSDSFGFHVYKIDKMIEWSFWESEQDALDESRSYLPLNTQEGERK